jgi:curli biogenesis system outer membrane secretion channel CsgG
MNKTTLALFVSLAAGVFLSSCGTSAIVVKPGYDFSQIKRVAVLDFKDASNFSNSGSTVAELFVKHLLRTGYNVIEREELESILREHRLSVEGILNSSQAKEFGKIAGVDAIITGSIPIAIEERSFYENGFPRYISAQVGLTCRMISVETGEVLWAGSDTYDGTNRQTAFDYLVSSLVDQLMCELARK